MIAADMEEFWNFPNSSGSIDVKHVIIECLRNSGSRNLNYKKTFSVVFLAVCDAHYRFTYIDIGHYGGEGDSRIFLRFRLLDCLNRGLEPTASGFHSTRLATDVREKLAKSFMNEGQFPWQERIVTRAGQREN
ncbi:hypothetical protein MRX96_012125 [Rhipicephalus microplus]